MGRRVSKAKLHRRLAEGSKLRIYKLVHEKSKCIACATKLFDKSSRHLTTDKRPVIKENPTILERMRSPEDTSGTPLLNQWWLQNEKGEVLGPFGEACGGKAVVATWTKEKRDAYRQQLLASGVPPEEVEDRLEQIAMQEWREMLRVYRQAEREAKKLNIDITTMTYDEVIAAIAAEKERVAYERALESASHISGLEVHRVPGGAQLTAWVGAVGNSTRHRSIVQSRKEVHDFLNSWSEAKRSYARQQAQAKKQQARAKYPEHVKFLEWAIEHPAVGYLKKRELEDWLVYIEQDRVYPGTLQMIEETASAAAHWVPPNPYPWPPIKASLNPSSLVGGAPHTHVPPCPKCGGKLVHKTGHVRGNGRYYDFYGCENWKPRNKGCDGKMQTKDYNAAVAKIAAHASSGAPVVVSPPPSTPILTKAEEAARSLLARAEEKAEEEARKMQLQGNEPQNGTQNRNLVSEPAAPEEGLKAKRRRRKKNAFWS